MFTTSLLAVGLFGLFFFMMGIGLFIKGIVLQSSCGGAAQVLGQESCGSCAKKEAEICPSDDETGLLNMAQISNPHKTIREHGEPDPGFQV